MRKFLLIIVSFIIVLSLHAQVSESDRSAALQLVNANMKVIGLSAEDISNVEVSSSFLDTKSRIRYVYLTQTYLGIPVYNQIQVLSFRDGKLISNFGSRLSQMDQRVNLKSGFPLVTAEAALTAAIADRKLSTSQSPVIINSSENGKKIEFNTMGVSRENITAKLMWSPAEDGKEVKLAWQVYIIPVTTSDYWLVRIDAANRSTIGIDNLTVYCDWGAPEHKEKFGEIHVHDELLTDKNFSENLANDVKVDLALSEKKQPLTPFLVSSATYRVIPFPYEAPSFMPGPSNTWHAIRTNPWTNATVANATTLNWHTGAAGTDYEYTRGNNVWAYQDRTPSNNTGTVAKSASSTTPLPVLTFDFTPDYTLEPTVTTPPNQQFNITNLFYWNNIIHDVFYGYGFTEAGGNFQDDNLGRGGVGNDHVNAEAQDGSGTNNANFATPADGGSGRMQMYLWTAPNPDRDGDVDNGIIIHEHGHGIGKRATGGPSNVSCLTSSETQGEGISDYFALMLTQDWAAATLTTGFDSPRGIGTYALNQPTTGPGIRPKRYTTNFAVNGDTYANLPGQAVPHGVGYIWCTMLWEMTWELINTIGTIEPNIYNSNATGGNVVALNLVMEGLRIQPCQPGFVDAKNAILQADMNLYGGANQCAIIRAFARRGVGVNALQGSVGSITDQTPDFTGGGPVMGFTQSGAAGVPEGQNIIYNHAVTANCQAITNHTLRDTLPLNVTFVSATNGGTYNAGNRVVSWPVNLAVNATGNYGLVVQINPGSYFPPVVLLNEPVPTTTISPEWTTASTTANVWTAHNLRSHSAPNSFFTPNSGTTSDQTIATTNSFAIGATAPELSFWHWYNTETNWDGGVLEISTNGGTTWTDIGAANFTQNGYNLTLNSSPNPLSSRPAWSGNSSAFVQTKVNMAPYANQPTVKLRWRLGSDDLVSATGWNVDDIQMQTIATVNMRTSLFNAANTRIDFKDTSTIILAPTAGNPSVTINQAAGQADPTTGSPINFTVVFSEPVIGFATGDVTISGTAGATSHVVTGSGATYNVAVSGMTTNGTVIATIAAGVCTNAALDPNLASTSVDNTVTYNLCFVDPVVTSSADAGPGSLRQAVIDACPGSTITFNMSTVTSPITLTSGEININKNLTIQGPGAGTLTISGGGNSRIFFVNGAGVTGTISRLTLTNGNGAGPTNTGRGGALYNSAATMNMVELVITGNTAANGGGFNTAGSGTTNLTNSTLSNNTALTSSGGGFQNFSGSFTNILNSTISGNATLTSFGGAMQANGTVTVTNSTISGNTSNTSGGGIYFNGTAFTLINSTVTNNTTSGGGGGIFRTGGANPFTIRNSIIAGNTVGTTAPDVSGIMVSQGYNLVGKTDGSTGFTQPTDLTGTIATPLDPMLGPLANNGGTTQTHALLSTSPAIDKGSAANNPITSNPIITDQRGSTRPIDIVSIPDAAGGNASDIGAFELLCTIPDATATPSSQTVCSGSAITTIVLSGTVGGTTFNWTRDNTATVTGIAANGTGNISGTLTNNTNAPVTVTFTITPISNGCAGPTATATVVVNPTPVVNDIPNQTVCNGAMTAPVVFSGTVPGTTYSWTNNTPSIGLAASGFGNIPAFTATNATTTPVTATVTVTPRLVQAGPVVLTGSLDVGDATLTAGRLNRNAVASTCAVPKTYPGLFGSGPYFYDLYTLVNNTGSAQCVTVDYSSTTTNQVHVTAYNGSFDPNNLGANYIADGGSSATGPTPVSFSFTAPAGATIVFHVFEPQIGQVCPGYTVSINGLPATCTGPSKTFDITVNPTPTITCPAPITAASTVGTCNVAVNYAATVTGTPAPVLTYSFSGATTGSGSGSGSGSLFNVGVTTVTLTATNICATVTCSFTVTVTDSQLPTITTQPVNRTVCAGSSATFSVSAVTAPSAGGTLSYQWQSWNGSTWNNIAGATSASYTVNNTTVSMNTNSFRVRITGLCTTVTSAFATLYVNSLPTVNLTTSIPPNLLPTQVLTITATGIPGGGSYVWQKNGVTIPGAGGNTLSGLTVSDIGTYRVIYTDPNGCTSTSSSIEVTAQSSDNIYVYPVPNNGRFIVRFYNQANEEVTLRIFDAKGAEVYRQKVQTTIPYTTINVDLTTNRAFASGVYVVDVRGTDGRSVGYRRIIVYKQ